MKDDVQKSRELLNYKCNLTTTARQRSGITDITDLEEDFSGCRVLVWNGNYTFKESYLEKFPRLELFFQWSSATSMSPKENFFQEKGIQYKNLKGVYSQSVAEFTIYMLFTLFNRVQPIREELFRKKIGIIGWGSIGSRVAEILEKAFDCEIFYFSRTRKDISASYKNLEDLVQEVDGLVISADARETLLTEGILQQRMSPLVIANISRDIVMPSKPLVEAIAAGKLPYIDFISDVDASEEVYEKYAPYYTPHIAYKTKNSILQKEQVLIETLKPYLEL